MKIQEIQFPLNLGIADELRVFTREDLETESSIVVHYILVDTTKTMDMGQGQQIPYKVMHSDKTVIEGEDYLAYKQDSDSINNYVANLLGVDILEEEL